MKTQNKNNNRTFKKDETSNRKFSWFQNMAKDIMVRETIRLYQMANKENDPVCKAITQKLYENLKLEPPKNDETIEI